MVMGNLSTRPFSQEEQEELSLGLKFATVPRRIPHNAIIAATETTCKQLKSDEANQLRKEVSNALHGAKLPDQNIDKQLRRAISDLHKDESITILPVDKGNITVVMDWAEDRKKMLDMLDDPTYKKLKRTPTTKIEKRVSEFLKRVERSGGIPEKLRRSLTPQFTTPPQIYGLPKVHKDEIPLRPIVASIGSPIHKLAKELARILSPLTGKTESFVKNSAEFAERIRKEPVKEGDLMVSFDITSLFTNVPVDDALQSISFLLSNDDTLEEQTTISTSDICELTDLCLRAT